jgi:DNA-binding NarL/FixJ family response regulator
VTGTRPATQPATAGSGANAPSPQPPGARSSHWQSVTEVVLSGDTSQEIRKLDIDPGRSGRMNVLGDIGAVFFTIDSDLAEMAMRTISKDRDAILATKLSQVVEAIEQQKVGVFVIDFGGNNVVLQKVIAALKSRLPELVSVVISSARDTTDMISLINNGRVYRYLLKPLEPETLRIAINAAAAHHLYLRNNPELAQRQEAVSKPAENTGSETLNQFFSQVRRLPNRDCEPSTS